MTKEEESKIREIIKSIVGKEIKNQEEYVEKQMSNLKKDINSSNKEYMTKKQVKDLMIAAFVKQNKFMWEKSKFITSYFNEL